MKVGDLIQFKNFPKEGGIVVKSYFGSGRFRVIDILDHNGNILLARDPSAFRVVK